ncbi:MAG: PD40 domain-containing protein [Sedimentisphaerales bacterium]|nr:PD40 domain-containing protein [Sedimentisphaerales bacterium]
MMISKTNLKAYLLIVSALLISLVNNVKADFLYGTPTNLGPPVNFGSDGEGEASISADGLSLYFTALRSGGQGSGDIWVTTRASVSNPWGEPVNLGPAVNSYAWDGEPSISSDGLSLYFGSQRSGGYGMADIWVTTRASVSDPWGQAVNLGPTINTSFDDVEVCISADGLSLYIDSFREGGYGSTDLWVAKRETLSDPWSEPINLGPTINTTESESAPSISADGRVLFFSDFFAIRPGGQGKNDIWMTTRASISDPWGEPINLGPAINTSAMDIHPNISADGSTLYFSSDRSGSTGLSDLWQVSIDPVVDLNSDGIVDSTDMCIIVDHWGTDNSLCDIGPTPLGDGIVDVQDLIVLSEHLFEDVNDPTLISHWALDETEGMTAHDSVNDNDDFVMGNALWQPNDGKINGAIELDGLDDCIIGSVGPNPADGPCSVIAWIKGGAPGQTIVAQPGTADMLAVDSEGKLMTGLNGLGQNSEPLLSQAYVTDGQWHRVALVWDGARRKLFVDGITVAEDTQDGQGVFGSGLYIGVGKNYTAGTFFSGLIDDVRIYNRIVSP